MRNLNALKGASRPVAVAVDYRGLKDDLLTFAFRGLPFTDAVNAFRFLVGSGNGIAKEFRAYKDTDVKCLNGKGYRRVAVELIEPDYHFTSLEDMKILLEAALRNRHFIVKWLTYKQFLNV